MSLICHTSSNCPAYRTYELKKREESIDMSPIYEEEGVYYCKALEFLRNEKGFARNSIGCSLIELLNKI